MVRRENFRREVVYLTQDTGVVPLEPGKRKSLSDMLMLTSISEINKSTVLSVIIPCYNEMNTLEKCVERVLAIQDKNLSLEIIIVDDCSTDSSLKIANEIAVKKPSVKVANHKKNKGKGAALKTGFAMATGDFVAVQDADLEYDPFDLKRLIVPLVENHAEVVLGSRFQSSGYHRVLYFWHYLGNKFLTLLSNMLTDLNLSDMETCYKVFKREIIHGIELKEKRFGFEPEIVAKVAQMRVRIAEMGVSYLGRTYAEGKKIRVKDGFRAIYCILKYNLYKVAWPIQFAFYIIIGGVAAVANLSIFLGLMKLNIDVFYAAPIAFLTAAALNYLLSILILFRHGAKWSSLSEILIFIFIVCLVGLVDLGLTVLMINSDFPPFGAKSIATFVCLGFNFAGRKIIVFPEKPNPEWKKQIVES